MTSPHPLRGVHTANFNGLLDGLGIGLAVSTYQAGLVVLVRADPAGLETVFRPFDRPMGLALDGNRLAVGTAHEVHEFYNVPGAARARQADDRRDACYLPRRSHTTGDVRVHELAWVGAEAVIVNTRFSCLCTLDGVHSFVPRWWPPFLTALVPEDRCHLNGLAVVDGRPRYVTALGRTDTEGGWRANKRDGGVVLEVPGGGVVAAGLSMPHSPRWHDGRLWVLQSGTGGVGTVDPRTGRYEPVAELPGFTRGLDFHGPFAFVGLSQVRETASFSGIPVAERPLAERNCGVWVVEKATGRTAAFLRFDDAVQEVFAVQVLPARYPDLVSQDRDLIAGSYLVPDAHLGAVLVAVQP